MSNPYNSPVAYDADSKPGYTGTRRVTIKSIDVLSAGKILGITGALLGAVVGFLFFVLALVGIATNGDPPIATGVLGGVVVAVMATIGYGIGGFIGGMIYALIYNVCAKLIGGLQFELEG